MRQELSVSEFLRGIKALRMGEYTLHAEGTLERHGVKVHVGKVVLDSDTERLTVFSPDGRELVTEIREAIEVVAETGDEKAAREHAERMGETILDLQSKLAQERETGEVLRKELEEERALRKAAEARAALLTTGGGENPASFGFAAGAVESGTAVMPNDAKTHAGDFGGAVGSLVGSFDKANEA